MGGFLKSLSSIIIFDLDDEVLDAAESQDVARFLIYLDNYLVGSPRVRVRWNSPSKLSNYFWTSLDALLLESGVARLRLRQRTVQSTRFTYPSTPLMKCICSTWEFLSFSVPCSRRQSPEILFWLLHYQQTYLSHDDKYSLSPSSRAFRLGTCCQHPRNRKGRANLWTRLKLTATH